MLIRRTDIYGLMSTQAKVSYIDVRGDVSRSQVTKVDGGVCVGKGGCNEVF